MSTLNRRELLRAGSAAVAAMAAGGIAAAFVPILTEILHLDKEKANEYVNSIITAATGTMLRLVVPSPN